MVVYIEYNFICKYICIWEILYFMPIFLRLNPTIRTLRTCVIEKSTKIYVNQHVPKVYLRSSRKCLHCVVDVNINKENLI